LRLCLFLAFFWSLSRSRLASSSEKASWGAAADHAADHQHTADLARGKSTSTAGGASRQDRRRPFARDAGLNSDGRANPLLGRWPERDGLSRVEWEAAAAPWAGGGARD
jgi:hypothetical protein